MRRPRKRSESASERAPVASTGRLRADRLLAERGLAKSKAEGAALVLAGRVLAAEPGRPERRVEKAGEPLHPGAELRLKGRPRPFVSRAGEKLAAALDRFGVDPAGRVCLDLGLSTGGFTDCLLTRGAARVHGVDVAYGIVHWRLRTDERLVLHERTNARHLTIEQLGERVSLVVADLSFIGLDLIFPALPPLLDPGADVIALVKPQFELPRADVDGGVVLRDEDRIRALEMATEAARRAGFEQRGAMDALVAGRDGNRELLLHLGVHDEPA